MARASIQTISTSLSSEHSSVPPTNILVWTCCHFALHRDSTHSSQLSPPSRSFGTYSHSAPSLLLPHHLPNRIHLLAVHHSILLSDRVLAVLSVTAPPYTVQRRHSPGTFPYKIDSLIRADENNRSDIVATSSCIVSEHQHGRSSSHWAQQSKAQDPTPRRRRRRQRRPNRIRLSFTLFQQAFRPLET